MNKKEIQEKFDQTNTVKRMNRMDEYKYEEIVFAKHFAYGKEYAQGLSRITRIAKLDEKEALIRSFNSAEGNAYVEANTEEMIVPNEEALKILLENHKIVDFIEQGLHL